MTKPPDNCSRVFRVISFYRVASAGLLLRLGCRGLWLLAQIFAGLLVDLLHRQAHLSAIVETQKLRPSPHRLPSPHRSPFRRGAAQVREMCTRPSFGPKKFTKAPKSITLTTLPVVDFANFRFGNDGLDPFERGTDRFAVGRRDLHRAVVLDVDLGAGLFDDFADHLAAGTDHFADLVGSECESPRYAARVRRVGRAPERSPCPFRQGYAAGLPAPGRAPPA